MFENLIKQIANGLAKHNIPYMIIGGQATLVYGVARLTEDIDITLGANISDLDRILKACSFLHLKILPKKYKEFVKKTMDLPVADRRTGIRIDFIFSYTQYESTALKRAKKIKFGSATVKFASIEDLIVHKIFAGRPRDIEDIKMLLVKNKRVDFTYIKHWLCEFDKSIDGKNFSKTFKSLAVKIKQ